jgi:uncharacterized membrane protein YgdD (TMEM256/DUF423 family)
MRMLQALILLASLMGAAGIVLAAAAAHGAPGAGLDSAGYLLLIHAAAILGGAGVIEQGLLARAVGLAALCAFAIGAVLFSSDVAMRAFAGHRLFPMAAPTGGTILIIGWLVLAGTAIASLARGG